MKVFFIIAICTTILVSCGKKSEPKYQGSLIEKDKKKKQMTITTGNIGVSLN
jgi:hypothetical protein|tara:strand:- start:750 stop:905 length:156 start_codon:yes stop_codon:yes gene_type:complete